MFRTAPYPNDVLRLAHAWQPDQPKMEALAFFVLQQVQERFVTRGLSGGVAWPFKRVLRWGHDDGRGVLTGHSARLRESFKSYATAGRAVVYSDAPYAGVHQTGRVIRARRAKALFIPITDRAITSERVEGPRAAYARGVYGMTSMPAPIRLATRGRKVRVIGPGAVFQPLVKGRLKDGKLQRMDESTGEYVDGIPDYIFLKQVTIPPRPMLPSSPREQAAQKAFVRKTIASKA